MELELGFLGFIKESICIHHECMAKALYSTKALKRTVKMMIRILCQYATLVIISGEPRCEKVMMCGYQVFSKQQVQMPILVS